MEKSEENPSSSHDVRPIIFLSLQLIHSVYYTITADGILVLRVLGASMGPRTSSLIPVFSRTMVYAAGLLQRI